jgi:hypothetical protein
VKVFNFQHYSLFRFWFIVPAHAGVTGYSLVSAFVFRQLRHASKNIVAAARA